MGTSDDMETKKSKKTVNIFLTWEFKHTSDYVEDDVKPQKNQGILRVCIACRDQWTQKLRI